MQDDDEKESIRSYAAAHALANPLIAKGDAPDWQLKAWFGDRTGIKSSEIAAAQAVEYADALLLRLERTARASS